MPIIRDRVVGLAPTSAGIKRGDQVKVITGRDRGKTGRVLAIDPGKRTITVEHAVDPARVRAHEVMDLRGDCSRLRAATGWEPEIPFRQTLADTIEWWSRELAQGIQSSPVRH